MLVLERNGEKIFFRYPTEVIDRLPDHAERFMGAFDCRLARWIMWGVCAVAVAYFVGFFLLR